MAHSLVRAAPHRSPCPILRRGHRIYEVPISYAGREPDEGKKITWRDGFGALRALIKFRFTKEF